MAQPNDSVILTHGLSKSFGDVQALKSVDLNVPRNSIWSQKTKDGITRHI